jgi:hypothetical protein
MLEAGAGCAKTSTLELAGRRIRTLGLALAFNKLTAEAMAAKLPGHIQARSFNSLGHRVLAQALGGTPGSKKVSIQLDTRKLGRLTTQAVKDHGLDLSSAQWFGLKALVERAMLHGLVPAGVAGASGAMAEDTREEWSRAAGAAGIDSDDFGLFLDPARDILRASIAEATAGRISFSDQTYLPVVMDLPTPRFPVVLVDEDQDLNPLNQAMIGKALAPGGRLIAVGDRRQAIYAWRGALGDSAAALRKHGKAWIDLPLMTTFRCPQAVVDGVQWWVPGFRAAAGARGGKVLRWAKSRDEPEGPGWKWSDVEEKAAEAAAGTGVDGGLAILCRNNAPILRMAFALLRRQVPLQVLGRDIGKSLVGLADKLTPGGLKSGVPVAALLDALGGWESREVALAAAEHVPDRADAASDKAEALRAILDGAEVRAVDQIPAAVDLVFSATGTKVTLSTVHKAKGQEWSTVLVLDPWRMPSKAARKAADAGDPVPLEQEHNLEYVAWTRTRDTLILANWEDFLG